MRSLEEYRRSILCPCGCGWPAEESQDPMAEFYRVPPPIRCHIRTRLAQAQEQYRREHPQADMTGLLWAVQPSR